MFKKHKIDIRNPIILNLINAEAGYIDGDYVLIYNCVAYREETCNKVIDFVINVFIEKAKDFKVNVTKK